MDVDFDNINKNIVKREGENQVSEVIISDIRDKFSRAAKITQDLERVRAESLILFKDMRKKLAYISLHMKPDADQASIETIQEYIKELPGIQNKILEKCKRETELMGEFTAVFEFGNQPGYFPGNKPDIISLRGYA